MNPLSVGPRYTVSSAKSARGMYSHLYSETPSLIDRIFEDPSSQQKSGESESQLVDYQFKMVRPFSQTQPLSLLVSAYAPMMEEHLERRVMFLYLQLIAVNKTGLYFESVGAMDQAKSASVVSLHHQVTPSGVIKESFSRNACHSATNPCLIAYSQEDHLKFKDELIKKAKGAVYLKNTDYYRVLNATMNMPFWMNHADREIDEKRVSSKLRECTQALINEVSEGELSPHCALKVFAKVWIDQIEKALGRLDDSRPEKLVLDHYKKISQQIDKELQTNTSLFLNLLDLRGKAHSPEFQEGLLDLRYQAIQKSLFDQNQCMTKIDKFMADKAGSGRKDYNYIAAMRSLMISIPEARLDLYEPLKDSKKLEHASQDRIRLSKLLNFSKDNFFAQLNKGSLTQTQCTISNIKAKTKDFSEIKQLVEELIKDFRQFQETELDFVKHAMNSLMRLKKLSESQLDQQLAHAGSKSSLKQLLTQKVFSDEDIQILSKVFEVNETIFKPQFFYL